MEGHYFQNKVDVAYGHSLISLVQRIIGRVGTSLFILHLVVPVSKASCSATLFKNGWNMDMLILH